MRHGRWSAPAGAIRSVDLERGSAEVVGLLGPSGAGKTALFDTIAGNTRITFGRVCPGERETIGLPLFHRARLGITYLPQETSVFRRLTVAGNIRAILETVEPERRARRARVEELLAERGLTDKAERRADSLSGGERRRVETTRALMLTPEFMLLD